MNVLTNLHQNAKSDLDQLSRVSHRLALTESSQLEKVLHLLLPRLLGRIGSNNQKSQELTNTSATSDNNNPHQDGDINNASSNGTTAESKEILIVVKSFYEKIHAKLVEMLSHIIKRVRADTKCKLPCEAILYLLYDSNTSKAIAFSEIDPFTVNLSLTFLTIGVPRCTIDEKETLLPGLCTLLGEHTTILNIASTLRKNQLFQISHLFLRCIEGIVKGNPKERNQPLSKVSSSSLSGTKRQATTTESKEDTKGFEKVRNLCSSNNSISAVIYDILLDVLLYQTSPESNIPPPGLSSFGKERLCSGASTIEKTWVAEYATNGRLRDLKLAVLDLIAPCRQWDIFNLSRKETDENQFSSSLSTTRAVTLMVVGCGDQHFDVSNRVTSYLKSYLNSVRGQSNVKNETNCHKQQQCGNIIIFDLLGDPLLLASTLMRLILGDAVSDNSISRDIMDNDSNMQTSLGWFQNHKNLHECNNNTYQPVIMSTKRRMVAEKSATTYLTFIASRIMDDIPKIFTLSPKRSSTRVDQIITGHYSACRLGSFVLAVAKKFVIDPRSLSGLSVTNAAGNAGVAAARLLNSLCVRLVPFYEKWCRLRSVEQFPMFFDQVSRHNLMETTLTKCFSVACSIVSVASSSHSGNVTTNSGVEARDAGYNVISTLARCSLSQVELLFNCGEKTCDNKLLSSSTATMLFGCLVNETEALKPRVIAALDSLLAAYCRLVSECLIESETPEQTIGTSIENPWMQTTTTVDSLQTKRAHGKFDTDKLSKLLQPLLWNAAKTTQPKVSRHTAAKWAFELLKRVDLKHACHLLCFIAGDPDEPSAVLAKEGLGLSLQMGDDISLTTSDGNEIVTPDAVDLIDAVFSYRDSGTAKWRPSYWDFSPQGQGVALRFGAMCLLGDLYGDEEILSVYLARLGETLQSFRQSNVLNRNDRDSIGLLDEASICLRFCLKESLFAKQTTVGQCAFPHVHIAELAATAVSSKARRYLASALGYLLEDFSIWHSSASEILNIDGWVRETKIDELLKRCSNKIKSVSSNNCVVNEVHGSTFLAASCIRALRLFNYSKGGIKDELLECFNLSASILSSLGIGLLHQDEVVGNVCSQGIAIAFTNPDYDAIALHTLLNEATLSLLKNLIIALRRFGNGDSADANRATLLAKASGIVLAATTIRKSRREEDMIINDIGSARLECVEALFALLGSTSCRKDPEMMLEVGDALTRYSDSYSPEGAQWTWPSMEKPKEFDSGYANELPPHAQVLYTLMEREIKSNNPHKRNACVPVLLSLVAHGTCMAQKNILHLQRGLLEEIFSQLNVIQGSFLSLLADPKSKQLARESCCIGLAACHGFLVVCSKQPNISSKDNKNIDARVLNERLLIAFGESKKYGGSAFMETRNQQVQRMRQNNNEEERVSSMMDNFGDTEVGGSAGIGEAALGAYREMANAAVTLDRPDILYMLMLLSVSLPIWKTKKCQQRFGASLMLGIGEDMSKKTNEMKEVLYPHMKTLIPRLLRACKDPNKQTREQMESLWIGITGGGSDARALVNKHFLSTIDILMDDAKSKLWRARAGACTALAEVLVGRTWSDLGGGGSLSLDDYSDKRKYNAASRIISLYWLAVRSLDDVRLTVRESGASLSRTLKSLTIRLCDSTAMEELDESIQYEGDVDCASSNAAASTILPWLVKNGLNSPCQEAVGFTVSCLLGIVDVASPSTLEPVLPELIGSLLMAMSGLEPAALNYLQTRAAGQDQDQFHQLERVRLQMAQAGPIAEAIFKCLDMLKDLDSVETKKAVLPHIDSALRCGAGFATRAAAADAVSTLCSQCPSAFNYPSASVSNPTVRLLRALYFASERERGVNARDKMIHAFGNLASLAPGKSVRAIAHRLCIRYKESTGSNDDPATRVAAAAGLRAIAVRASNQFNDGGSQEIWMRTVLPLAYIGRYDRDAGTLFEDVWDEGGGIANLSERSKFMMQLEEKILPFLTKAVIEALSDVSWDRRILACSSLNELCKKNILAPGPCSINHESISQEGVSARHMVRAECSTQILIACVELIVKSRIWSGKSDLIETCARIAVNWAPVALNCNTVSSGTLNLYPVCANKLVWDDLFIGDSWFLQRNIQPLNPLEEDVTENLPSTEANKDDRTIDMNIDFAKGDEMLHTDNEGEEDDDDTYGSNTSTQKPLLCPVSYTGLCRVMLEQGIKSSSEIKNSVFYSNDALQFRAASLNALSMVLKSHDNSVELQHLHTRIAPTLTSVIPGNNEVYEVGIHNNYVDDNLPPLIIAKAIDCLGCLFWCGMQFDGTNDYTNLIYMTRLLIYNSGEAQAAWTVRVAAALAAAKLVLCASWADLTKVKVIDNLMECSEICEKDKKFWKVRSAKLKILNNLCVRVKSNTKWDDNNEKQLILEALLPVKEKMLSLAKSSLRDKEAAVSAIASDIIVAMSVWP